MTDLHCHILPGMDDGAREVSVSLEMLRLQREQDVQTVCLTPHFYPAREEPFHFLRRREKSLTTLLTALYRKERPRLILGAEVAWVHGLEDVPELPELCYAGTEYLLVEPPFTPWTAAFFRSLLELMDRRGITPVIAHLDRYTGTQRPEALTQLYALEVPVQLSAAALLSPFTRGEALKLLRAGRAGHIISDAHNLTSRPPNLGPAAARLRKTLGPDAALLLYQSGRLVRKADSI